VVATARILSLVPAPRSPRGPARLRSPRASAAFEERLARALERHLPFVWRVLRRMGLSSSEGRRALDDVFGVLAEQAPVSRLAERALLAGAAVRLASKPPSVRQVPALTADPCDAEVLQWDDALALRDSLRLIDGALGTLPVAERAVFVLIELEGMTRDQVAAALELSRRAVSARLSQARAAFDVAARRALADKSAPISMKRSMP
jgi:DNA-directed RNA polymerase specialized sigma24 family protein